MYNTEAHDYLYNFTFCYIYIFVLPFWQKIAKHESLLCNFKFHKIIGCNILSITEFCEDIKRLRKLFFQVDLTAFPLNHANERSFVTTNYQKHFHCRISSDRA